MFESVKSKVNLLLQLERDLQVEFKESGTDTYSIADEKEQGGCPFCSHKDCFRIRHNDNELSTSIFTCFSCSETGSVLDWVSKHEQISLVEAARKLAKEHNITLPKDFSPIQEIFNVSAGYYHNLLLEATANSKLAKMTPIDFQVKVRGHTLDTLTTAKVGWSDGNLCEFLESVGFDAELLEESGLRSKKTGKDFLPKDTFMYPHFVKGRVSHYTFKDPQKKLQFQLPNKAVLNGCELYGQDSIQGKDVVILVEGENDLLSVVEHSDTSTCGVLATIGSISGSQLDWLRENLQGKDLITIFDPDDAGAKYREKVAKIKSSFKSLVQVLPPEEKDIDDLLRAGKKLSSIIEDHQVVVTPKKNSGYSPPSELANVGGGVDGEVRGVVADNDEDLDSKGNFFEKHGCYYKVKYKDGEPTYTQVSNFTIELLNVYLTEDGDRLREIVVIREDGYRSDPVEINSETKVSRGGFRTFLARAADVDFTGNDFDLVDMWKLIYSKTPDTLVKVTRVVGRSPKNKGWITRESFVSDTGAVIKPDDSGIFWLNGKIVGIRPETLNKNSGNSRSNTDIPYLDDTDTPQERDDLLRGFLNNLALNLGDIGTALLMVAWMNACAYSDTLFAMNRGFPMLFVWGSNGQGKGTICAWLMSMWDLEFTGKTTIAQLKSAVGFGRKAEYYASFPMFIDEVRADLETKGYENMFRSYYDRDGRSMGTREGFGVRSQEVRACFMFAGEDHFEDPATKERCLTVRVPVLGRETVESFRWIDERKTKLSSIGFKWLLESVNEDHKALGLEVKALEKALMVEAKCSSRKSKNWSAIGTFAIRLGAKYFPEFDIRKYLYTVSSVDSFTQKTETTVSKFFDLVESIQSQEGLPKINTHHMMKSGDMLHIWFSHVYRVVNDACHGRFPFTKSAVLAAIKEEPYYVSDDKKIAMGMDGVRRTCITIDTSKLPSNLSNLGICT